MASNKNNNTVCLSESEIDGEFLDVAIKGSIRDLQQGLCEVERHLLNMIDKDEIDALMWVASHQVNVELLNLVKEVRPSSKSLKVARDGIKEQIDTHEKSG